MSFKLFFALSSSLFSIRGTLIFGTACLFALFIIELCRRALTFFSRRPTGIKLRLQGSPTNSEPDQDIEFTMDALMENGLNDPGAPLLISRLEWWNRMKHFMEMLSENKESLDMVVTSIEVLLNHHQFDRSKVEKDLVRIIYDKALRDPTNSHLYARLCQRLMESKINWTINFTHRVFQLVVDEVNSPLVIKDYDQLKSNKTNIIKLMAAIF
jgi:hypothetical protein